MDVKEKKSKKKKKRMVDSDSDSDYIPGEELNSGLHHLYELVCSGNIIDSDTLIVIDDTDEGGEGKGKFIMDFVQKANLKIILNEGRQFAFTMGKNK